eukprot:14206256-Ditylum_brightwellii.AAC.1
MARRNLLLQQYLVDLRYIDAISKTLIIIYLSQVEVTINNDSDTDKEWITSTMSDAAVRSSDDFPVHLMGNVIDDIPETDSINPTFGDDDLCIISLPA